MELNFFTARKAEREIQGAMNRHKKASQGDVVGRSMGSSAWKRCGRPSKTCPLTSALDRMGSRPASSLFARISLRWTSWLCSTLCRALIVVDLERLTTRSSPRSRGGVGLPTDQPDPWRRQVGSQSNYQPVSTSSASAGRGPPECLCAWKMSA
jgi:hypothetical protein